MTQAPLTRGAREVREQLMAFYEARLPIALATARAAWDLTEQDLPTPQAYDRYEALTLDQLPRLALSLGRAVNFGTVDHTDAVEKYEVRYPCRLFAWLKDREFAPTQRVRDDYASVLASVLLATPSLGSPNHDFRYVESTLEITYSDAAKVKGDRWVAGVSLSFDVLHREILRRVPLGDADAVIVDGTVLP